MPIPANVWCPKNELMNFKLFPYNQLNKKNGSVSRRQKCAIGTFHCYNFGLNTKTLPHRG